MAWYDPRTWFKPPETEGKVYVTEKEAESVPEDTQATVVVVPTATTTAEVARGVEGVGGRTIRRGTGNGGGYREPTGTAPPTDASYSADVTAPGSAEIGEQAPEPTGITPGSTGTGGMPVLLTKQEAEQYRGRDPYWKVLSPPGIIGMTEAIDIETKYGRAYKPITYKNILGTPKGVSILNIASKTELQEQYLQEVGVKRAEREFNVEYANILKGFEVSPSSFEGEPGFSKVETEGKVTYSLSPEYFKTLPSYQAYQRKVKGYETFISTKYELGTEGESYFTTPEYKKQLISQAKTLYEVGVSKEERARGVFSEYLLGGQQLGAKIISGSAKYISLLGVQTIGEGGGIDKPVITFKVSSVPTTPASYKFTKEPIKYIGEAITTRPATAVYVPAVTGAVVYGGTMLASNIVKYGAKLGVVQTLSYASPLRISPAVYVSPGKPFEVKYDVTKVGSRTYKADITGISRGTYYPKGVFGEETLKILKSSLSGSQIFTQTPSGLMTAGAGGVQVTSPSVSYIGGRFLYGAVTTKYTTIGMASLLQGTKGYFKFDAPKDITGINIRTPQGTGFLGDTLYRQTSQVSFIQTPKGNLWRVDVTTYPDASGTWGKVRGAGVKQDITPTKFTFKSGVREYTYGITKTDTGWVYSPKKVGFRVDIYGKGTFIDKTSGKEIMRIADIDKFTGIKQAEANIGSIGKKFYTTPEQMFQSGQISTANLNQIVSTSAGTIQAGISKQVVIPIAEIKALPVFATSTTQKAKQEQRLIGLNIQNIIGGLKTEQVGVLKTIQSPITPQTTATALAQEQRLLQVQTPETITAPIVPPTISIPPYYFGGGFIIPPPFIKLGGLGAPTTKTYKGKRKFKYTPSYEAFVFGIRGKKPTGIETGLRVRPITPGFSIFNIKGFGSFGGFKMPKFSRIFKKSSKRRKKKKK